MTAVKKNWISEKATDLKKDNQYVFLVEDRSNKSEVKKELSRKYGVEIDKINIVRIKGKEKRFGRNVGRRSSLKKAIVKLKPGHKIEIT